ncbi:MAG TPA: M20/M25/M40 family metallo-hydrolase [Gaiellaceae bacterium]|nr:M20/M25/M40 family metallo-hydrolase [Gaiellaceae bacterium]
MTDIEERVTEAIVERGGDLVALASALVAYDTTARNPGDPARDEAALQEHLATRLRAAGAEVDVWEPVADDLAGRPLVPRGLDFAGRPQLHARFPGAGEGRSLLFNGHIDAVSYEPRERWSSDPLRAEVREGKLFGRGACDMKGGVAAMVLAAETLASLGIRLAGDLHVVTNTDEESSGAGGMACVAHGIGADGGIVTEPTGFDVWVACRGGMYAEVSVPGRPGHAELAQPHWREGGAVNAIEKATVLLDGIRRLREEWRGRADTQHPYLAPASIVPTVISAGEWAVTYPASCRITCDLMYVPAQGGGDGWPGALEGEVTDWLLRAAAADPWLAENAPEISFSTGVPAMEIDPDEPIVGTMLEAAADVGRPGRLTGLDSWYDGATFTLYAGTPSIAFGPGSIDAAHTIDESVRVDDLVACAQALAVAAIRFCGVAA